LVVVTFDLLVLAKRLVGKLHQSHDWLGSCTSHMIGQEDGRWNDIRCVKCDVKPHCN